MAAPMLCRAPSTLGPWPGGGLHALGAAGVLALAACAAAPLETVAAPEPSAVPEQSEGIVGEGEAAHSYTIDNPMPVASLKSERLAPARKQLARAVWPCLGRTRGKSTATAYLRWDGRVVSVGVAPPSAAAEDQADCVAEALHKLNLGKQRSALTKATFRVP
jgi:threonine dehydrogenase-like Zn-dependent dehydrogenase